MCAGFEHFMKLMPFAAMKSNVASVEKKYIFFIFNPLTAKDKIPRPGPFYGPGS